MKISTKGRYALRVMMEFAEHKNEVLSLKSVAEAQNISLKYLEQIVQMLVKAKLLDSFRGSAGGYKLAQEPSQIKVSTILRATEGDLAIVTCLGDENCAKHAQCRARRCWNKLNHLINEYLDNLSLAELLAD